MTTNQPPAGASDAVRDAVIRALVRAYCYTPEFAAKYFDANFTVKATPPAQVAGSGMGDQGSWMGQALHDFTEYFVKNYPGPDTIICDPTWHAPKLFRNALWHIEQAQKRDALAAQPAPVVGGNLVPGVMRCAKCKFQLIRNTLYLGSGTIGAGTSETEPCPNGCGPLWPVTWEEYAKEGWEQAERFHGELQAALSTRPAESVAQGGEVPLGWLISTEPLDVRGYADLWKDKPKGYDHLTMVPVYTRPTPATGSGGEAFDMRAHLLRQREWSMRTFGPGPRTQGVVDHIRKELLEILADPTDISEWIDVVILALDGAWRAGASPLEIIGAIVAKQTKNEGRNWPDWRTADPDKAIEHDRSAEANPAPARRE